MRDAAGNPPPPGRGPLFSIITATLNRSETVIQSVESVLRQEYDRVEHLILDGGSTDPTMERLSRYGHLRIFSEPDEGLYHAWNKGLGLLCGDVVGILNSDDLYAEGVLHEVAAIFEQNPEVEVVTGRALRFESLSGSRWRVSDEFAEAGGARLDPGGHSMWGPKINARFFRRRLLERVGLFDVRYRYSSDCDYMLRIVMERPAARYLARHVYYYRSHEESLSLDPSGRRERLIFNEKLDIAERWLEKPEIEAGLRDLLRRWHSEKAAVGFLGSLRHGRLFEAAAYGRRALGTNPSGCWAPLAAEIMRIVRWKLGRPQERVIRAPEIFQATAGKGK